VENRNGLAVDGSAIAENRRGTIRGLGKWSASLEPEIRKGKVFGQKKKTIWVKKLKLQEKRLERIEKPEPKEGVLHVPTARNNADKLLARKCPARRKGVRSRVD